MGDSTVLVQRCEGYDSDQLQRLVTEGMERLGYRPAGKVFVKPNVVFAGAPEVFGTHAYTDPTLVEAALLALSAPEEVQRVDIGENSAVGFPTRHCLRHAGYYDVLQRVTSRARCPVAMTCMDEDLRDEVCVDGLVHETIRLSRTMARADTKVYLPKLKCHCVGRMTGAVKLNIGICCDDDRSIGHDFMLNDKIVDLLTVGWPDFIVMDAIEVGVGNEAFPVPRKLGLLLMGRNPLAMDIVGARLLGLRLSEVPYLERAVERGYAPGTLDEIQLAGDLTTVEELDQAAQGLLPYDDDFRAWQDIDHELTRLSSPIRFYCGPHRYSDERPTDELCETGCVMGIKMFLASYERYAGGEAFARAKPVVFVVGDVEQEIDARGAEVFLVGKCAKASVTNARKVIHVEKCFTTASDLTFAIGQRLGIPAPSRDPKMVGGLVKDMARSSLGKVFNMRFAQDIGRRLRRRD